MMRQTSIEMFASPSGRVALASIAVVMLSMVGCVPASERDRQELNEPKVEVFFNDPGSREGNQRDLKPSEFLVERIDAAKHKLDVAAYGFEKANIAEAVARAHERGVDVRFVGDSTHMDAYGYQRVLEEHIPAQFGNQYNIMHNKFFIIDNRFVFMGTGNLTPTGFERNNNNWVWMESKPIAQDFTEEFEQMFNGSFSASKEPTNKVNTYEVGDTEVEVYFSPQEQAMSRIIEEVKAVDTSIHFQIFAFTKNELGSAFIRKHRELMEKNEEAAEAGEIPSDWRESLAVHSWNDDEETWPHGVVGLVDRSQVHGNGQYHEVYRMSAYDIPMRIDSNEASNTPGDYQKGGGRLHTKTMILDAGTEDARVLTGSFNWSSSATVANDETFMILRGEKITDRFMDMYGEMWLKSKNPQEAFCSYMKDQQDLEDDVEAGELDRPKPKCADEVEPGDVIISEVHWDGWNGQKDPTDHTGPLDERSDISNDQFIELYNTTDQPINLSLWTVTTADDFVVGLPPGTIIEPGEHYVIADHNTEPYSANDPQRGRHAFTDSDFVLNTANDPRFPRLNFKNTSLYLELRNPARSTDQEPMDKVGNRGPAFAGGRVFNQDGFQCNFAGCSNESGCESSGFNTCICDTEVQPDDCVPNYTSVSENVSMERVMDYSGEIGEPAETDGTQRSAWEACSADQGGENVRESYRDRVIATPGERNTAQPMN